MNRLRARRAAVARHLFMPSRVNRAEREEKMKTKEVRIKRRLTGVLFIMTNFWRKHYFRLFEKENETWLTNQFDRTEMFLLTFFQIFVVRFLRRSNSLKFIFR